MPTSEPIEIDYTLRARDGSSDYETVHAPQVPRVGELVSVDGHKAYEVVDVLWKARHGGHSVVITACETDWHQHIDEVLDERSGAALSPADTRHLVELMQLIDWSGDHDGDSAIPQRLHPTLEQHRWSMLQNALLDWDIIRTRGAARSGDAVFRLAVIYTLPVFEGASAETDRALGELLADMSSAMCEAPGAVEGLGRRWRDDLCATAWRLLLAHHRRDRDDQ